MQFGIFRSSFLTLLVSVFLFCGCDQPANEQPAGENDDLQATEILDFARDQYAAATSYQDLAVLYLTYRLNGRAIQEPHPWSLAWNKSNQLSADWFNARIRCDGQQLSCYVFDIASGNIDNQQIMIPADGGIPVQSLIDDGIARHFIFGTSELPLDESEAEKINPLVHPILGFLDSTLERDWLVNPHSMTRLPDAMLNELECYVLEISQVDKEYRVWIGQESGRIEQIELPLQYLHSDVLASSEISDLKFFVRFHGAELNKAIPDNRFAIEEKLAAKRVRHFVTLPQAMASELIGKTAPEFTLYSQDGSKVAFDVPNGKAAVFFWLSGTESVDHVAALNLISKQFDADSIDVIAVYSDEHLESPGSLSVKPAGPLSKQELTGLQLLYDKHLEASSALKLKAVPSVLVLDKSRKIQYAKAIDSDDWREHTMVAANRVLDGDQIAGEMETEYQKFLDEYHRQLVAANAATVTFEELAPRRTQKLEDIARLEWDSSTLRNPGNIHLPMDSKSLLVFDGWQTVVEFDRSNGRLIGRHLLELPDDAAVNRIRSFKSPDRSLCFVAFSFLGKHAFVFDEDWNLRFQYPNPEKHFEHAGITDCQLGDFNDDGKPELLCSFLDTNGIREVNIDNGREQQLVNTSTRAFYRNGKDVFHVVDDRIAINGVTIANGNNSTNTVSRIIAGPTPGHCLAVGTDKTNQWKMFRMTGSQSTMWCTSIGAQHFDNEIEPICVGQGNHEQDLFITVISNEARLSTYTIEGKPDDSIILAENPSGVAAWATGSGKYLAISSGGHLKIWNLKEVASGSRPADTDSRLR